MRTRTSYECSSYKKLNSIVLDFSVVLTFLRFNRYEVHSVSKKRLVSIHVHVYFESEVFWDLYSSKYEEHGKMMCVWRTSNMTCLPQRVLYRVYTVGSVNKSSHQELIPANLGYT